MAAEVGKGETAAQVAPAVLMAAPKNRMTEAMVVPVAQAAKVGPAGTVAAEPVVHPWVSFALARRRRLFPAILIQ